MGNNQAYVIWEHTIIALYDVHLGIDIATLDAICNRYRGTDIDSGGSTGLLASDGKDAETIAVLTVNPDFKPSDDWTIYDSFSEISYERWGWR